MSRDLGRSPDGSGSRPTDRAADGVSPVPASISSAAEIESALRLKALLDSIDAAGGSISVTFDDEGAVQ